jgi:hypothetical protein
MLSFRIATTGLSLRKARRASRGSGVVMRLVFLALTRIQDPCTHRQQLHADNDFGNTKFAFDIHLHFPRQSEMFSEIRTKGKL